MFQKPDDCYARGLTMRMVFGGSKMQAKAGPTLVGVPGSRLSGETPLRCTQGKE